MIELEKFLKAQGNRNDKEGKEKESSEDDSDEEILQNDYPL